MATCTSYISAYLKQHFLGPEPQRRLFFGMGEELQFSLFHYISWYFKLDLGNCLCFELVSMVFASYYTHPVK